jgi:ribosomal protein S18 acetylase RimI-like enzyme
MERGDDIPSTGPDQAPPGVPQEQQDDVEIRQLKMEHIPQVAKLMKDAFRSKKMCCMISLEDTPEAMQARYAKYDEAKWKLGAVAVSKTSNQVLGHVQMTDKSLPMFPTWAHTCKPGELYIEVIAVGADARGKGVGSRLLAWCDTIALQAPPSGQAPYSRLTLEVLYGNPAIGLYARKGFHTMPNDDPLDFCCASIVICCFFGRPYGCCDSSVGSMTMEKTLINKAMER